MANAIAIPLNDFWIMPCGLLALALMPLGLDTGPLHAMGQGVHLMLKIASHVASWPGAITHVPLLPETSLILAGFGALWIILWRQKWRRLGIIPIVLGGIIACFSTTPDLLVSEDSTHAGIRLSDGTLAVSKMTRHDFTVDAWNRLGSHCVIAMPAAGTLDDNRLVCQPAGYLYTAGSNTIAIVRDAAALDDDCTRATIVISPARLQANCTTALVIDPQSLAATGALGLYFTKDGYRIANVAETTRNRPWVLPFVANTAAAIPPVDPAP